LAEEIIDQAEIDYSLYEEMKKDASQKTSALPIKH
jgi:hypothetical protein